MERAVRVQLCSTCGADIATTGHLPACALIQPTETDPRYAGLDDIIEEATTLGRVAKTPRTPNPDDLPDGPTSPWAGKGRAA